MQTTQNLRIDRDGDVATVVFTRPDRRNAFDDAVIREVTSVAAMFGAERDLRAVIFRGEGPAFSSGADARWMQRLGSASRDENVADARRLAAMFEAIAAIPVTTFALVHGTAVGGGAGLVAAVDVAIAEPTARFGFTEVRLGIIPAVISAFVVPAIGARVARRYFATGEIFDAATAARIGLVSEVVAEGAASDRIAEIIGQLRLVAPFAAREARRLPGEVDARPFPAVLDHLSERIAEMRTLPEAREGLAAFIEKRPPNFQRREGGA